MGSAEPDFGHTRWLPSPNGSAARPLRGATIGSDRMTAKVEVILATVDRRFKFFSESRRVTGTVNNSVGQNLPSWPVCAVRREMHGGRSVVR